MTRLSVGVVQMMCEPNAVHTNAERATPLVEQAADEGARLVVLPELFSSGYEPSKAVWDAAEPSDGPTAEWLAETAERLHIYLGAGSVERDGTDVFNVFILAGPEGEIAGRAYKANAEANVFKRDRHEHVIQTEVGRVGVGICADNQFAFLLKLMHERDVDLILMPHAWPTPFRAAGPVSEADVAAQQARMVELPALYSRSLGVPVAFVNQIGPLLPIGGILGRLMDPKTWRLRGQSRIMDSDGSLLGALGEEEGVLVSSVVLDPARKHYQDQPSFGGWLQPGPRMLRKLIIPLDTSMGKFSYARSKERRRKAGASAGSPGGVIAR